MLRNVISSRFLTSCNVFERIGKPDFGVRTVRNQPVSSVAVEALILSVLVLVPQTLKPEDRQDREPQQWGTFAQVLVSQPGYCENRGSVFSEVGCANDVNLNGSR